MTIGQRIAAERAAKGLTQSALAQRVGLAQATVANIELGRREPSWAAVQAIAKALGMPAWKLARPL